MNTLMRKHVLRKGGGIDKYTSVGSEGYKVLMKKYYTTEFKFNELDLPCGTCRNEIKNIHLHHITYRIAYLNCFLIDVLSIISKI